MVTTHKDAHQFLGGVSSRASASSTSKVESGVAEATLSAMSGATVTAAGLIPAGAKVKGVVVEVLTTITGATTFKVGDGTDDDKWGTGIALTAGTKTSSANFTAADGAPYASATGVVLTATGSNFTAGAVKVTVHYEKVSA